MSDNTVDISFKINGVETAVKSVEELQSAVSDLETTTKAAEKQQGFFSKKFADFKTTLKDVGASFGDLKGGFSSMSKGLSGIAKGFGLSAKSANIFGKVTASAIAATGIGLLIPLILALVNYFKNLEGAAKLLDKALAAVGAVVANIGGALKKFFSGDFSGAFKDLSDSVGEAVSAVDDLYDAEKRLAEIKKRTVIENAKLNQEIEAQKKILEDTTLSLDDRIVALDKVTAATQQLAKNQLAETQAALDGAQAQLTLTNNYEERRAKQQEIAELQAQMIEQTTALQNIEYDAEKVGREIRTASADERKARAQERIDMEKSVNETLQQLNIDAITDEEERALAQFDAMQEKAMEELENNRASKEEKLEAERLFLDQRNAIIDEYAMAESDKKAAEDEEAKTKRENDLETLNVFLEAARLAKIDDALLLAEEELRIAEEKAIAEVTLAGATADQIALIQEQFDAKRKKLATADSKFKAKLAKDEKAAALGAAGDIFAGIASMAAEGSALQKGSAIAAATINTYQAATNAFANTPGPPPIPAIAAGLAVTAGLLNIKKIMSVQPPGGGGGGGGVAGGLPSVPSVQQFDPSTALAGNVEGEQDNTTVTLGGSGDSSTGASVIRAYVVSDEMTTQQEADKKINDLARL